MRHARILVFVALALATVAQGQQPQSQQPQAEKPRSQRPAVGMQTPTPEEPLEIWQIDLNPSGTGFALTRPVLEGDVYVFKVWPDRSTVRLPRAKVKNMTRRTQDINGEVLYQIDLVPTGQMYSRENPTRKETTYVFHTWRENSLMSVRHADVKKITRVAGLEAFKIHLQQLGAKAIDNVPMEGGGTVRVIPAEPAAAAEEGSAAPGSVRPGNWIYDGVPGVTSAWAPPSAVVSSPGDVPKAQEPRPRN
jgi:hypothetical protein